VERAGLNASLERFHGEAGSVVYLAQCQVVGRNFRGHYTKLSNVLRYRGHRDAEAVCDGVLAVAFGDECGDLAVTF
jgi:hypothetical protein